MRLDDILSEVHRTEGVLPSVETFVVRLKHWVADALRDAHLPAVNAAALAEIFPAIEERAAAIAHALTSTPSEAVDEDEGEVSQLGTTDPQADAADPAEANPEA